VLPKTQRAKKELPQKAAKNYHSLGQKMAKTPGFPRKMKLQTPCKKLQKLAI
jgi:hypothetical protein